MRVLIVDKMRLFCHTLKVVLQKESTINIVGYAANTEQALHQARHADVVLINVADQDQQAHLSLIRDIVEQQPALKVLVLGIGENTDSIVRFIEAGAAGYISREDTADKLIEKLRAAELDQALVSPHIAAQLMSRLAELTNLRAGPWDHPNVPMRQFDELTPREWDVLKLLGKGLTNQEIADRLYIEHGTVKNHVHRVLKKLNASNRHEAAAAYTLHLQRGEDVAALAA